MYLSQSFDARIQQLKEGDPTAQKQLPIYGSHKDMNITKKVCLEWDTGRKMLFHYAHFMTADFDPQPDFNTLTLEFMTRNVTLKGYHLESLFNRFLLDEPYIIPVISDRYASMREPDQPFVIDAIVEK